MSKEDQRGPALKRARRAVLALDGVNISVTGDTRHGGVVAAEREAALALAEETARLADEQRTANLLAFFTLTNGYGGEATIAATGEQVLRNVADRLGIK